jgi:hypothetical protein
MKPTVSVPAPFNFLYSGLEAREKSILGNLHYVGPSQFNHGEWHTIAKIEKDPEDGDGQSVEIQECRMPARFFRLNVLAGNDSMGDPKAGYEVTTGSGYKVGLLVVSLAKQISKGMIGFEASEA